MVVLVLLSLARTTKVGMKVSDEWRWEARLEVILVRLQLWRWTGDGNVITRLGGKDDKVLYCVSRGMICVSGTNLHVIRTALITEGLVGLLGVKSYCTLGGASTVSNIYKLGV